MIIEDTRATHIALRPATLCECVVSLHNKPLAMMRAINALPTNQDLKFDSNTLGNRHQ